MAKYVGMDYLKTVIETHRKLIGTYDDSYQMAHRHILEIIDIIPGIEVVECDECRLKGTDACPWDYDYLEKEKKPCPFGEFKTEE